MKKVIAALVCFFVTSVSHADLNGHWVGTMNDILTETAVMDIPVDLTIEIKDGKLKISQAMIPNTVEIPLTVPLMAVDNGKIYLGVPGHLLRLMGAYDEDRLVIYIGLPGDLTREFLQIERQQWRRSERICFYTLGEKFTPIYRYVGCLYKVL